MLMTKHGSKIAGELVSKALKKNDIAQFKFALTCNVSESHMSRILNGSTTSWSPMVVKRAAELLVENGDIEKEKDLVDILSDAPPPLWMKDLIAFKEEILEELHRETEKIISASDALQAERIERQKEFMKTSFSNFKNEVAERVNNHQQENLHIIEATVKTSGAELHKEAQKQLKASMDELFEGGQMLMSTITGALDSATKESAERTEYMTKQSKNLENMIADLRNVTTQITADFESELANLKRMLGSLQTAFESHTAGRETVLADLKNAIEDMKDFSEEKFAARTQQIAEIRKFQEEKFSSLSD